jgi:hypothetical protein
MNLHLPEAPASLPASVLLAAMLVPAKMPALPGFIRPVQFNKEQNTLYEPVDCCCVAG